MAKLNEARLAEAKLVLDRHRKQLLETRRMNADFLEMELPKLWGVGYQDLKGIMIDLLKTREFRLVAARYMETDGFAVVTEFHGPLAGLYGISHHYSEDRETRQAAFWKKAFAEEGAAMAHVLPFPGN